MLVYCFNAELRMLEIIAIRQSIIFCSGTFYSLCIQYSYVLNSGNNQCHNSSENRLVDYENNIILSFLNLIKIYLCLYIVLYLLIYYFTAYPFLNHKIVQNSSDTINTCVLILMYSGLS
jgi:hypothetical protein